MIPEELQNISQWTHSYSKEEIKRPAYTQYEPNGSLTYHQAARALNDGLSIGLYVTHQDPYVLGDIDYVKGVDELPPEMKELLQKYPTYVEWSPSGHGFRFIYKLPHPSDKPTDRHYYKIRNPEIEAQVNIGRPWQRITGKEVEISTGAVATVPLDELDKVFKIRGPKIRTPETEVSEIPKAPIEEVEAHLMRIPLDQNLRVKRAYTRVFGETYNHYDFWMKVLMALHDYAVKSNQLVACMSLADRWSAMDEGNYAGEDDVLKHWQSLSTKENSISYRTLFKLARICNLIWPIPRPPSKRQKELGLVSDKPVNTEVENFTYMMDFYNVDIMVDVGNPAIYYYTCDPDIKIAKGEMLFEEFYGPKSITQLISILLPWMQGLGWRGVSRKVVNDHILTHIHSVELRKLDPVKYYFDTPFYSLPPSYQENDDNYDRSTFEDLWECIEIDHMTGQREREEEIYKCYYKIWLFGLIRSMYFKDHQTINNCVLLLTGQEQIRKTSHFRFLLPEWMRTQYISFTTHGFSTDSSMRDIAKISASSRILVWDELEQYLNQQTESNFKKIIDSVPQRIIDKYEVIPRTIHPVSIYGATSNLREFRLGDEGSRRLFHIPVKWVDTDRMSQLCWHKLINDLKDEAHEEVRKGNIPWLLNEEQLQYQRYLHSLLRSKNNIDMLIEEVFDFDMECPVSGSVLLGVSSVQGDTSGRLMTTRQVINRLYKHASTSIQVTPKQIEHSLTRLCRAWTKTERRSKTIVNPTGVIEKGRFIQGSHRKWIMPDVRKESSGSHFR